MKRLLLSILAFQFAFLLNAQSLVEFSLLTGPNKTSPQEISSGLVLLPDLSTGLGSFQTQSGDGFNLGALLGWQFSPEKAWMFKSGVFYSRMNFSIYVTSESLEKFYFVSNYQKVQQWELPLFLAYKKSLGKFELGIDIGLIKSIYIDSEIQQNEIWKKPDTESSFSPNLIRTSGFVPILDKFSFYLSPFIQRNIGESIGLTIQPYYRQQIGSERSHLYTKNTGAINQFGINFGFVKQF